MGRVHDDADQLVDVYGAVFHGVACDIPINSSPTAPFPANEGPRAFRLVLAGSNVEIHEQGEYSPEG